MRDYNQYERIGMTIPGLDKIATDHLVKFVASGTSGSFISYFELDEHTADAAIEAVGTPEATRTAADMLRPGGAIGAVGFHVEPHLALSPGEIYDRNLRYAGGRCPARAYMPRSLEVAMGDEELLASLISHRLPLSEGVGAYRSFAAREPGWNKVVLYPGR